MKGRVLVLCATRDRNLAVRRMLDSVASTSNKADVALYIDEDQGELYNGYIDGASILIGKRIGPVASLNDLVKQFPGYEAYGAATDDCEFRTPGWDEWVLKTTESFPAGIGLMAPKLAGSNRMDFPWATAKWIEAMGWFAFPGAFHFYWDVMSELIGEATAIKYATAQEFYMVHDDAPTEDIFWKTTTDARNVLPAIALQRPALIKKLKAAIEAACPTPLAVS